MSGIDNSFKEVAGVKNFESALTLAKLSVNRADKVTRLETISQLSTNALESLLVAKETVDLKQKKVHELCKKFDDLITNTEELGRGIEEEIKAKKTAIKEIREKPSLLSKLGIGGGKKIVQEHAALEKQLRDLGQNLAAMRESIITYKSYDALTKNPLLFQIALKFPENERFEKIEEIKANPLMQLPAAEREQFLTKILEQIDAKVPLDLMLKVGTLLPASTARSISFNAALNIIGDSHRPEISTILASLFNEKIQSRDELDEMCHAITFFGEGHTREVIQKMGPFIETLNPEDLFFILEPLEGNERAAHLDPTIAFCQALGNKPLGTMLRGQIEAMQPKERIDVIKHLLVLFENRAALVEVNELMLIIHKIPPENRDEAVEAVSKNLTAPRKGREIKELLLEHVPSS